MAVKPKEVRKEERVAMVIPGEMVEHGEERGMPARASVVVIP